MDDNIVDKQNLILQQFPQNPEEGTLHTSETC